MKTTRHTRVIFLFLAIIFTTGAMAKERTGVFVSDVVFKNVPSEMESKYKALSQVLAGQIQQVIGESPNFQAYTLDDFSAYLQDRLNVQRATCSADDKCIRKLMTNRGASDLVSTWVTLVDKKYYVKLTHFREGEVVRTITDDCPMTDAALSDKLKTLTADLFGISSRTPGIRPGVQRLDTNAPGLASAPPALPVVVTFSSEPPGAVVLVDGHIVCRDTARGCSRNITKGWHTVEMQKERYDPARKRVRITKNQSITLRLTPNFGTLTIRSDPPGLAITMNKKGVGNAPVTLRLDPGVPYTVDHANPCMFPSPVRVVLAKGQNRAITLNPKPKVGWVQVTAQDRSGNAITGQAFADGRKLGPVPGNYQVSVCAKKLEVKTAKGSFSTAINPDPDRVARVNARIDTEPSAWAHHVHARPRRHSYRVAAWVTTGISAALLGTGIALVVIGNNRIKDLNAHHGDYTFNEFNSTGNAAKKERTAGWACAGIGAAGAIAGIVLFAIEPKHHKIGVGAAILPHAHGIRVFTRF